MTLEHAFRVYPIEEDDGTIQWICEFPDLKGCIGVGDTYDEAIREGMLNRIIWIETAQAMGREAPNDYSFRRGIQGVVFGSKKGVRNERKKKKNNHILRRWH